MPDDSMDASELTRLLMQNNDSNNQATASPPGREQTRLSQLEAFIRIVVRDEVMRQASSLGTDIVDHRPRSTRNVETSAGGGSVAASALAPDLNAQQTETQVMNADDVAAFLGVDRNTVYDYAGRGTIPCRRLGKRLLFHRPALVSWLDPCKAASTRKD